MEKLAPGRSWHGAKTTVTLFTGSCPCPYGEDIIQEQPCRAQFSEERTCSLILGSKSVSGESEIPVSECIQKSLPPPLNPEAFLPSLE